MKIAKITFKDPLTTIITHLNSGSITLTDAPKDNNGDGKNLSPTDMVACSLGSCIMTIIGIYCIKRNIKIESMDCTINKEMINNPRRIGKIGVTINILINDLAMNQKNKIEEVAKKCPVAMSLSENLQQEIIVNWN